MKKTGGGAGALSLAVAAAARKEHLCVRSAWPKGVKDERVHRGRLLQVRDRGRYCVGPFGGELPRTPVLPERRDSRRRKWWSDMSPGDQDGRNAGNKNGGGKGGGGGGGGAGGVAGGSGGGAGQQHELGGGPQQMQQGRTAMPFAAPVTRKAKSNGHLFGNALGGLL